MGARVDLSQWYGAHYFRTYRGAPYERSPLWLGVMNSIADGIVAECAQARTVLDVGCALGFLVEALRDRGVEAFGLDLSSYAIGQVHERARPYCWVASVLDPLPERYDLIICHEVLEHLPPEDADAAVARLCGATDDVIFSSTPDGYDEDTHLNVQPIDYWASLFARHGFVRDLEFNRTGFVSRWACRFRRSAEPLDRIVAGYERRAWTMSSENVALRARVMEQAAIIARVEQAMRERPETAALEQTVEEQQEHLDALADRLTYMTDREADMRRLLLDSHDQLLQRDQMLLSSFPPAVVQQLQALVAERTAWAQRAVEELDASRAVVRELQQAVEARTTWAQDAVAEVDRGRAVIDDLRAALDDRTAWAQRAVADTEQLRAQLAESRGMADERTNWAQRAIAEVEQARAQIDEWRATADEHARAARDRATVIETMARSRSWRASAPLRRVRQLLNGSR
jgi:SAM-dependent methyltransferase